MPRLRNKLRTLAIAGAVIAAGAGARAEAPTAAALDGASPRARGGANAVQLHRDEIDMLERARAEHVRRAATPSQLDEQGASIREQAIEAEVAKRLREAERAAEFDQLTAGLRRNAPARGPLSIEAPAGNDIEMAPAATMATSERATVLLLVSPGSKGIRRLLKTADPILCMPDVCWISRGPDQDARMVPRRKALGILNSLGARAGACNASLGCVFRNVELTPASATVQPVDLRLLRHDRREAREVRIDTSCRVLGPALSCGAIEVGPNYRMWAVPEQLAREAGGRVLAAMVGPSMPAHAVHRR